MNIIKLNATNSTNTYLGDLVKESMLKDEVVVVATHQKNGRGQREATWHSQPAKSLTFSVFKRLEGVLPNQQFNISMVVSIAIANYLKNLIGTDIKIKWPNDIMAEGKKCGGILIENQLRGKLIKSTIIGVGLNINEKEFENLPQATSLHLVSGNIFNLDLILEDITSEIFKLLNLLDQNKISELKTKYEQLLFKNGVLSRYRLPNATEFSGTIEEVNSSGQLILKLPDGKRLKFWNKELEMLY